MSNHPTIASELLANLKAALESERDTAGNILADNFPAGHDVDIFLAYKQGHEAATERLMTIIEKAVEMASFYAPSNSYDYDKTQGIKYIWNDQGKIAREFLSTLADAGVTNES